MFDVARVALFRYKPPIMYLLRLARSGWQRSSRSGRGFPKRFFMPLVMIQAQQTERANPSQPACSSHSLRCHISDFGVPFGTVAPGTKMREMTAIRIIGIITLITTASHTGTVSSSVNGKLQALHKSICQTLGMFNWFDLGELFVTREGSKTYAILRSSRANGLLFGVMWPRTYPTAPTAASITQSTT